MEWNGNIITGFEMKRERTKVKTVATALIAAKCAITKQIEQSLSSSPGLWWWNEAAKTVRINITAINNTAFILNSCNLLLFFSFII